MADKKSKRLEELRNMSAEDLGTALESARRSIFQIRRERLSKPQQNVKATKAHRKEIARILTLRREQELGIGHAKPAAAAKPAGRSKAAAKPEANAKPASKRAAKAAKA